MKLKVKDDDNVYKQSVVLVAQEKRKSRDLEDG
jgi:hypothetical protein